VKTLSEKYGRQRRLLFIGIVAVHFLIPLFLVNNPYLLYLATQMVFFTLFAYAFNLYFGFTKQLYLCLGAFAGIGAYITGIAVRDGYMGPVEAIALATLATTCLGLGVSYLAVKRKFVGIFTGVFTLAITLAFQNLVVGLSHVTGGETGFRVPPIDFFFLNSLPSTLRFYIIATTTLMLVFFIVYYILFHRNVGYAFKCILSDEFTAELIGVDVVRLKVLTAGFASALLGFVGALYSLFFQLISPSYYAFSSLDIPAQLIVILGGRATLTGPFIGSVIIMIINESLRLLGHLTQVIYGAVLVFLLAFFRNGVVDFIKKLLPWFF